MRATESKVPGRWKLAALLIGPFAALATISPGRLAAQAVATPPALGPAPTLRLPAVRRGVLPNGLTIKVVEMHKVPLVRALLLIEGGARLDGARPGLATFTATMLEEGAGTRDALTLSSELDYLGASLSTSAGWDNTTIALDAPKRTFAQAMDLMADVTLRPTFRATDVERQRDLRLSEILQQRDEPAAVASLVFLQTVFPEGHPYHRALGGDSASTVSLDSAMVREFWQSETDPRRATLIFTGDVTLAEATRLATAKFGQWRRPTHPVTAPSGVTPDPPRPLTRIVLVDKPNAAQSVISIGGPGVSRRSPDYAAITLMNTILGGSFSSRLNDILREQKGYTYGAGSVFQWRPVPGPFFARASVRTDVTDSSLAIFVEELQRIRAEPVSDKELKRAQSYVVLGALGGFETSGQVAGQLAGLTTFGLPLETIPSDLAAVRKLTVADVRHAAEKYLDPTHYTVVIVGDLAKIRPGIEALHLGPISVRDAEGNPLPPP